MQAAQSMWCVACAAWVSSRRWPILTTGAVESMPGGGGDDAAKIYSVKTKSDVRDLAFASAPQRQPVAPLPLRQLQSAHSFPCIAPEILQDIPIVCTGARHCLASS